MNDYRILVVDDEEDLCEILKFNLENEGYFVDTANSAEEALKMELTQYNLLLLDVMMGEISGFKLLKALVQLFGGLSKHARHEQRKRNRDQGRYRKPHIHNADARIDILIHGGHRFQHAQYQRIAKRYGDVHHIRTALTTQAICVFAGKSFSYFRIFVRIKHDIAAECARICYDGAVGLNKLYAHVFVNGDRAQCFARVIVAAAG